MSELIYVFITELLFAGIYLSLFSLFLSFIFNRVQLFHEHAGSQRTFKNGIFYVCTVFDTTRVPPRFIPYRIFNKYS